MVTIIERVVESTEIRLGALRSIPEWSPFSKLVSIVYADSMWVAGGPVPANVPLKAAIMVSVTDWLNYSVKSGPWTWFDITDT